MRALVRYSLFDFIDTIIAEASGNDGEVMLILCKEYVVPLPQVERRSTVTYLNNSENVNIVEIFTEDVLMVLLAKYEADLAEARYVPRLYIWHCSVFRNALILSKLTKFETTLGEEVAVDHFKKWCVTIISK